MKWEDFVNGYVDGPDYGNAPDELVQEHKQLMKRMEKLHEEGVSLSSPEMLELSRQINELNQRISATYSEA